MNQNLPTELELAEQKRNVWCVKPTNDTTVEDMLKPEYWAHTSTKLRAGDRIEAVPDNRSFFVEFFVLAASKNWAKVILMREVTIIKDTSNEEIAGFSISFAGTDKWRVTQGNTVLSRGHDDKTLAAKWLEEHLKEIK